MSRLIYITTVVTLVICLSILTGITRADNANFRLEPLKEQVVPLTLQETDTVSGSFSVISNDDTGVNFYVTDPQNNTILRFDNVKQKNFQFTAESQGTYQLHFDNSVSATLEKTVALNYTSIHYIMGMPQEQFYFVLIAAIALIGILLYVVLLPK